MQQYKDTFIINLGGSLIVPDAIDVPFLKKFHALIVKQIEEKGQRFLFITGGGRTCRLYQNAAAEINPDVTGEDKDWLGIHCTRLNAHLIRTIFRDYAYPRINKNPHDLEDFYQCTDPVIIAAGWRPGFSTDNDTALLAKYLNIKTIINLSNIDYIYDKDPNKFPDAKKLEWITWKDFRSMFASEWTPGSHTPFDPVASKLADEEDIAVVTMNGTNLENLEGYLNGKDFEGSVIAND